MNGEINYRIQAEQLMGNGVLSMSSAFILNSKCCQVKQIELTKKYL